MRTLQRIVQHLQELPHGASADGRAIGLGLDAALQIQRKHGADVQPIRPTRPTVTNETYSRAS